jgi:dihydrofolate synthase/folylpolyglutamate synthase
VSLEHSLSEWLERIERLHPQAIALGLDRVERVKQALGLEPGFPIVTVGGTNGKGSVCAMLEAVLHCAGYRVGCYTSPHLLRYNERVRIGMREAADSDLARAFDAVETARKRGGGITADAQNRGTSDDGSEAGRRRAEQGPPSGGCDPVPLTYFEFGTLAALWLFVEQGIEAAVLEVGLGGRLDAVNAFDADCAVVVSVDLDHMDYLGSDRETIGYEKAGIYRAGRPAICADPDPPASLRKHAADIGARWLAIGTDFGYERRGGQWRYWGPGGKRSGLPYPALRGSVQLGNAAAAITALDTLRDRVPVAAADVRSGLLQAELAGRFQVLPGRPAVILDVAHNPHAARALATNLRGFERGGRTLAVFSMLGDKDIAGVIEAVKDLVDHWFVAGTGAPRGASAELLAQTLAAAGAAVTRCQSLAAAYAQACDAAAGNDKILVFGSFYTVAAAIEARALRARRT